MSYGTSGAIESSLGALFHGREWLNELLEMCALGPVYNRHPLVTAIQSGYEGCLVTLLRHTIQTENILGTGSRAMVYTIPKLSGYVLHVQYGFSLSKPQKFNLKLVEDPLPNHNIGQVVATLYRDEVKILRYQAGTTYKIPYSQIFQRYNIDDLLGRGLPMQAEDIRPYRQAYAEHLAKVAAMPQSAYDDLAHRIRLIDEKGLFLDPCSLNILIDETNPCFNTVDHNERIGPYQNVLGMACALLDTMYVDLDEHAVVQAELKPNEPLVAVDPKLMALRKQIMQKVLRAAFQVGLKLPEEACPLNQFGFHQRSFDMNYALRISGLKTDLAALEQLFNRKRSQTVQRQFKSRRIA